MYGRWVEIHVYTYRAFLQRTKTGFTRATWNRVDPGRKKKTDETIKFDIVRRGLPDSQCLRQNKLRVPEGLNLRQGVKAATIHRHKSKLFRIASDIDPPFLPSESGASRKRLKAGHTRCHKQPESSTLGRKDSQLGVRGKSRDRQAWTLSECVCISVHSWDS